MEEYDEERLMTFESSMRSDS